MKVLLTLFMITVSINSFAAKPNTPFAPTKLKMIEILLNVIEADDNSDATISSIRYTSTPPDTINVLISLTKDPTPKDKEEFQAEFDEDVNYIGAMVGSDKVKAKIQYAVVKDE